MIDRPPVAPPGVEGTAPPGPPATFARKIARAAPEHGVEDRMAVIGGVSEETPLRNT